MHTRALFFGKPPLEASGDFNQRQAEKSAEIGKDAPSALLPKSSHHDIISLAAFKAVFLSIFRAEHTFAKPEIWDA